MEVKAFFAALGAMCREYAGRSEQCERCPACSFCYTAPGSLKVGQLNGIMGELDEEARGSGNSSGPVMGGINIALGKVENIPPGIQSLAAAQHQALQAAREREESSTERHAERE